MAKSKLDSWLARNDDELSSLLADEIRTQVRSLIADGDIYGYAIMPGLPYEIRTIASAFHRESDLGSEHVTDDYYRFGVNEWKHYLHDGFENTNALIDARNRTFDSLHTKDDPDDFCMDDYQIGHIQTMQKAILGAMLAVRDDGLIGGDAGYAIVWVNDTDAPIMKSSAKELNLPDIYDRFYEQFA